MEIPILMHIKFMSSVIVLGLVNNESYDMSLGFFNQDQCHYLYEGAEYGNHALDQGMVYLTQLWWAENFQDYVSPK